MSGLTGAFDAINGCSCFYLTDTTQLEMLLLRFRGERVKSENFKLLKIMFCLPKIGKKICVGVRFTFFLTYSTCLLKKSKETMTASQGRR